MKNRATSSDQWFDVDRAGLKALLDARGRAFAIWELVQNSWDAEGTTRVDVTLKPLDGRARWRLVVADDSPDGFHDLTHAYRMFAPSEKKADPTKRGRFNLGEKLVLAICESAVVTSTTGAVRFDESGRRVAISDRRQSGSEFDAVLNITKAEAVAALADAHRLIPSIETWINGDLLPRRVPLLTFTATLPTIVEEDGVLRNRTRLTDVTLYDPEEGEEPSIYELGIPVVESGDRWSVDVGQKVPLNQERDNVPPSYLRRLRTEIANRTVDLLTEEDTKSTWVKEALEDDRIEPAAVKEIITKRFGENAVVYDPSDREANKLAMAEDRPVIYGSSLSKPAWENVRRANTVMESSGSAPFLLPAGRVTPSPVLELSPDGVPPIPESEWSDGMRRTSEYAKRLAELVGVGRIDVKWMRQARNSLGGGCAGAFGHGSLRLNLQAVGNEPNQETLDELLIHEFGHHWSLDHFDHRFLRAVCSIGAKMAAAGAARQLPRREQGRIAASE